MSIDFIGLGLRIKHYRNKMGYTQAELAEKTGLSEKQISRVENGKRCVSVEKLIDISEALKTSPNDLLVDSIIREEFENTTDIMTFLMDCKGSEIKFLKRLYLFFGNIIDSLDS